MWIETVMALVGISHGGKFIRQQWRMWIETAKNGGRWEDSNQFIRQQWRMWIETAKPANQPLYFIANSFASNGECGLKRSARSTLAAQWSIHSPAMANVD